MTIPAGLKVAIVGSGPSGFYAAEALINSRSTAAVDIFDKLPVPFGLVRYGVAPDHQKLKQVTTIFTKIAADPRIRFFGNVEVGSLLSLADLQGRYHAVIIAVGASGDRKMGIQREDLLGCYAATAFVGWYNGHPDYRHLKVDLSCEHAVIVGQGNVAVDICRVLAKPMTELARTDIARHALDTLSQSNIRRISIVGRRGPAQAKFTPKEIRELGELADWDISVDPSELVLNQVSAAEIADRRSAAAAKTVEILNEFSNRPRSNARQIRLMFYASPHAVDGVEAAEGIVFERTKLRGEAFDQSAIGTGEYFTLDARAIFRSVGYAGIPFSGLPFDQRAKVIPNQDGRVLIGKDNVLSGVYVTGWIKRGPMGIIGTNRVDSIGTVSKVLEDIPRLREPALPDITEHLERLRIRWTCFDDWHLIDKKERANGQAAGCVRQKIVDPIDLMTFATNGGRSVSTGRLSEERGFSAL